jgi:hypothetical protein
LECGPSGDVQRLLYRHSGATSQSSGSAVLPSPLREVYSSIVERYSNVHALVCIHTDRNHLHLLS